MRAFLTFSSALRQTLVLLALCCVCCCMCAGYAFAAEDAQVSVSTPVELREAIANAKDATTITLQAGTYAISGETLQIPVGAHLTLKNEGKVLVTRADDFYNKTMFYVPASSTLTLAGEKDNFEFNSNPSVSFSASKARQWMSPRYVLSLNTFV